MGWTTMCAMTLALSGPVGHAADNPATVARSTVQVAALAHTRMAGR